MFFAGNKLEGASDYFGLNWLAAIMISAFYGAIATGVIWLPLFAIWRLFKKRSERGEWPTLIPAIIAFCIASNPTGKALAKRVSAYNLEQQVNAALAAPAGSVEPWRGIDLGQPGVIGLTYSWLLQNPDIPLAKLEDIAAIFPDNSGIATQLAQQQACSLQLLETLWGRVPLWRKKDELRKFEEAIAKHAATSDAFLWRILRETPYTETRDIVVARLGPTRPGVYDEYLRVTAECRDHFTRSLAAKDPRLSPALMMKLATDDMETVRENLATNPALPFALLEQLSADREITVRHSVVLQPAARAEWREKFYREAVESKRTDIRYAVLNEDPNISLATLTRLSADESWGIRETVARHPKTPREIIEKLANDTDAIVSNAARERLRSTQL
jgi:Leucine rich repeat variant